MIFWIVKDPEDNLLPYTFSGLEALSQAKLDKYQTPTWEDFYQKGYRCVRVKVEEVE